MSLFSSLYTGSSGMLAQSRMTESISNNIANATTVGYKRTDVAFQDLMSNQLGVNTSSNTLAGGVSPEVVSRNSAQGTVKQTDSITDLSIIGDGFFIVSGENTPTGSYNYTRSGSFAEDANGFLRNTAGYVLYGYATDTNGVPTNTLEPIDLNVFQTQFFETSEASIALNLDAEDSYIDPHSRGSSAQQLPIDNLAASFSRNLTVYDDAGEAQDISIEFRRTIGPMAHFTSGTGRSISRDDIMVDDSDGPTPGITNGDQMVLSDGTETLTIDFVNGTADTSLNQVNSIQDLVDVVNNYTDVDGNRLFVAQITENERFLVQAVDPTVTLDLTGTSASVLGSSGLNFIQDPDTIPDYTYEPDFDITAAADPTSAYPDQDDLPAIDDITSPNTFGWWEMTAVHVAADGTETTITQGLLNFDTNGQLNATADANGNYTLSLNAADLPFGSTEGINVDMTRITQYSGVYNTIELEQNGAPAGRRSGVSIGTDGLVSLQFDSENSLPIYQIPLAIFTNADGLVSIDGTAFGLPADGSAGEPIITAANSGAAGQITASTLENSNVDLANEFSEMIIAQRVYSSNSQLVQAVNEMTQTLTNLKG